MDRLVAHRYTARMAQMVSEVYDALRSVNVPEDKARKAAEALAWPETGRIYDTRFDRIESDLTSLKTDVSALRNDVGTLKADVGTLKGDVAVLRSDVAALKTDSVLMKWMIGFTLAIVTGILARLLFVG